MSVIYTPLGVRLTSFIPHYPHPAQEAFLALPIVINGIEIGKVEALYGGAAGGGKSDALLMGALQYVDVPGYAAIIFRRTFPELRQADSLIPRSKEWLRGTNATWNENDHRWTFPSGATLAFGHLQHEDDKYDYQSAAFQYIGFDELTHFTESQYRYLFSRLRKPDSLQTAHPLARVPLRMRAASNPGGKGHEWVKRRFIDRQPDPDDLADTPDVCQARAFIPARLRDNPSLDQEAYQRSLAALEPELRAQLLDGDWDARQPGDWYFENLTPVIELGRQFEALLQAGDMPAPSGGVVHLGIDWGESSHALLGWPLEAGGVFIAREHASYGAEPSEKTLRMLALNEWDLPWGRAFFDAAGVQSQKTFNSTADRQLGYQRPAAKSIPFGARAPATARGAARSFKGVGCSYLRRLARRAAEGHLVQVLAVSPRCPELLRQLKLIQSDPEDPTGSWLKDDDQHGPDAAVALVSTTANRHRVAVEAEAGASNGRSNGVARAR